MFFPSTFLVYNAIPVLPQPVIHPTPFVIVCSCGILGFPFVSRLTKNTHSSMHVDGRKTFLDFSALVDSLLIALCGTIKDIYCKSVCGKLETIGCREIPSQDSCPISRSLCSSCSCGGEPLQPLTRFPSVTLSQPYAPYHRDHMLGSCN